MSGVPSEIEINILLRLPVQSLVRFRCVCKNWLGLLTTDPHFIKLHLTRASELNKRNPRILLSQVGTGRKTTIYSGSDLDQTTELESPIKRSHELIGCSNGILCYKHCLFDDGMHLWNPSTREHCTIPTCPVYDKIAYFGFGYDECTNQYKVVRIGESFSDVYVYTLGTSWRNIGNCPYMIHSSKGLEQSSTLVNGALHWILLQGFNQSSPFREVVVSFDLKDELFTVMPLPNDYCDYLGDLGGLLCTFVSFVQLQIWVMKEYGVAGSWTMLLTLQESIGVGPVEKMRLVGMRKNGELVVCKNAQTLLFHNLQGYLIKLTESSMSENCRACSYIESLVSPRVIAGFELNKGKEKPIGRGKKRKGNSDCWENFLG